MDAVNNVLQEDLSGIRVVKAFVQEQYETRRYDRAKPGVPQGLPEARAVCGPAAADAVPGGEPGHRRRCFWFGGLGNLAGEITAGQIFRLCPVPWAPS